VALKQCALQTDSVFTYSNNHVNSHFSVVLGSASGYQCSLSDCWSSILDVIPGMQHSVKSTEGNMS